MRRCALRKIAVALLAAICCSRLAAQSVPPAAAQAVFVAYNSSGSHIDEYTTTGALVRTLSGGPSGSYAGLAFGADGFLYVTNTFLCPNGSGSCNELERFDPSTGAYLRAVGSITPNTTPFSGVTNNAVSLNGLAPGPGNDLYVTTNQLGLYKIDPAANTTTPITTADCCTYGVAFLPDGTPLSINSGQNAVQNDLTGVSFNSGFFASAQALAFGPDGRLYVLQGHEIDTIPGASGAFTPLTASNAVSRGLFMTFDSPGHIWVTDINFGVLEFDSATGQQIGGFASNKASAFAGIAIGPVFGNVWAWGDNGFGELGNGTTTASLGPSAVSNLSNVVAIADGCCDDQFGLALKSDGTVWAWGANGFGELGNGTNTQNTTPVQANNLTGVTAIAADWDHAMAVKSDGTVWTWGYNANGQLGNGTTLNSNTPVQVTVPNGNASTPLSSVIAVAAGDSESMALKSDGTVWVWGYNGNGQLGIGTTSATPVTSPVQVSGISGVIAIAAGNANSLVLKSDGTVWGWGYNLDGRLGTGTTAGSTTPVQASGLSSVIAIATGDGVSLALKSDGSVWAWGSGPLGNGTTAGSTIPVQVQSLSGMTAIAAGSTYSLALKNDGTVWAWGNNGQGQLGTGTKSLTPVTTPVQVNTLSGVTAVAAGDIFSLAIQGQSNGVATHFSVSAPASTTAGTSFNFAVTALDASNHTVAGYTGTVHFTSADPLAALPADYTFTAADNGIHTFGATLNTAGSQTITATDTANATSTGVSGPTVVSAATPTHFLITAPPSVTGGTVFNMTVTASDAFGNSSTSYVGTVHFTSTDGLAVLPTDYAFTAADQGTHVFTVTLKTGGNQTITATDTASLAVTGTSGPVNVAVSLAATHFNVSAPASATAGAAFSVTVTALNAASQVSTSYTGTVHFASTDGLAVVPADYTFTVADNGVHVFSVTLNTPGSQTITATDTANSPITGSSGPISVASPPPPVVQITDNETVTVSDTESFPDVFDAEAVHVADAVFVTPLIAVTAPVAEFSAGGLGFGGQSGTQTITVSNIGQAPLTLASAAISGSPQFNIAQISCSNGATSFSAQLPVGGVCALTINYAPSATPANDNAMLVFNDNAALSNLPTAPSGGSYIQSVPLSGGGANIAPPPPPPATVSVMDNEMVHVTDAESFPDVFDAETVHVQDQVSLATLQAITVTPANSTIANGATEQLTAIGTFSDGSNQDLTSLATWSSSNVGVATMNGSTATAVGLGQTTITATLGSIAGSTPLTVRVPFLRINAALSSIARATNGGYSVTISVTNTGDIAANSVTPLLGILGGATTGVSAPVTSLAPGATATLILTFPSSAGTSGSTQALFVLGLATGTDPNGAPAPPALWLLRPRQVTLP